MGCFHSKTVTCHEECFRAENSKTIKKLELHKSSLQPGLSIPLLSGVTEFSLVGVPIKNFKWLVNLPNLKTLVLESDRPEEKVKGIRPTLLSRCLADLELRSLTTFRCNYYLEWSEDDIDVFGGWMPNLKSLQLDLGNDTFHLVPLYWPRLRWLQMVGDHLDDSGVTGMEEVEVDGMPVLVIKYPFSILDLKELHTFSMQKFFCGTSHLATRLTKTSVLYGFLKCPRLKCIEVELLVENNAERDWIESIPWANPKFDACIGYEFPPEKKKNSNSKESSLEGGSESETDDDAESEEEEADVTVTPEESCL